ncbi:MAG: BTAD domain-containing putative transcriptional regulator [Halanaerobium sp.]
MGEEIRVYTLGNFRVLLGGQELTKNRKKLSKRWQLFQYLITFRNREVSRDELITNLKLNKNENPEGALSALVYRLRKVLNSNFSKRNYIETAGTAYTFNNQIDYWLDIENLEKLCKKTLQVVEEDFEKAVLFFEKAVELYDGDYLEELEASEWIWSLRNKYRELLVTTLLKLDKHFSKTGKHNQLWQLYNQVQQRINYDERLIKGAIEALIADKCFKTAWNEYQEFISLYQKNGLMIPPEIKVLESKIKQADDDLDLVVDFFNDDLNYEETEGAFICYDKKVFSNIYELEKRRHQRDSIPSYLLHLRLTGELFPENVKIISDKLLKILLNQLRCGDVICPWDDKHFIILLTDIKTEEAEKVISRITNYFNYKYDLPPELVLEKRGYQI